MKNLFLLCLLACISLSLFSQNKFLNNTEFKSEQFIDSEYAKDSYLDYKNKRGNNLKQEYHTLDSLINGEYDFFGEQFTYEAKYVYGYDEYGYNYSYTNFDWEEEDWYKDFLRITNVHSDSLVSIIYHPNGYSQTWKSVLRTVYVYDENDNEVEKREYNHIGDTNVWDIQGLNVHNFNEYNNPVENIRYYKYDNSEDFLRPSSKDTLIYNEDNLVSQRIYYQYNYDMSVWEGFQKHVYSYDESDLKVLDETYYYDDELLVWSGPSGKIEYQYDEFGNKILERESNYNTETEEWGIFDQNTWEYDTETNSYIFYEYIVEDNIPVFWWRSNYIYNTDNQITDYYHHYYENDDWQPSIWAENVFDIAYNAYEYNYYNWDWGVMEWKKVFYHERNYYLDAEYENLIYPSYTGYNELFTGVILSEKEMTRSGESFKNDEEVFFYWSDVEENTGIEIETAFIAIYPNPVHDFLKIDVECLANSKIYNLQGKLLIESNSSKIDVSNLTSGVYLLTVLTKNGVITKKIVKN